MIRQVVRQVIRWTMQEGHHWPRLGVFTVGLATAFLISQWILDGQYVLLIVSLALFAMVIATLLNQLASLYILVALAVVYSPLKDFSTGLLAFIMLDLLFVVVVVGWIGQKILERGPLVPPTPLGRPLLVYAAVVTIMALNPTVSLLQNLMGWRAWLLYTPLYLIGYETFDSRPRLERFLTFCLVLAGLVSLYGVIQYVIGPKRFMFLSETLASRHGGAVAILAAPPVGPTPNPYFRIFSTMVSAGALGSFCAFFGVVALHAYLSCRGLVKKIFYGVLFLLILLTLFLTASRSSWIAFFLCSALLCLLRVRRSTLNIAIAGVLVYFLFLVTASLTEGFLVDRAMTLRDQDFLSDRISGTFVGAFEHALEYPLGRGLGHTGGVPAVLAREWKIETRNMDNEFGRALLEMGWIGLALLVYFVIMLFRLLFAALRAGQRGDVASPLTAVSLALVTVLVGLPVGNPLGTSIPQSVYFWLLLGAAVRLTEAPA